MSTQEKKGINEWIIIRKLGYNFITGQWLEDWHPWEKIEDFMSQIKLILRNCTF